MAKKFISLLYIECSLIHRVNKNRDSTEGNQKLKLNGNMKDFSLHFELLSLLTQKELVARLA